MRQQKYNPTAVAKILLKYIGYTALSNLRSVCELVVNAGR